MIPQAVLASKHAHTHKTRKEITHRYFVEQAAYSQQRIPGIYSPQLNTALFFFSQALAAWLCRLEVLLCFLKLQAKNSSHKPRRVDDDAMGRWNVQGGGWCTEYQVAEQKSCAAAAAISPLATGSDGLFCAWYLSPSASKTTSPTSD